MSARSPWRIVGAVAVATSLVASITPAQAVPITRTAWESGLEVYVSDCPTSGSGKQCRAFFVQIASAKNLDGPASTLFRVRAFDAVTIGGGFIDGPQVSQSAVIDGGSLTIAISGAKASFDITADLVCDTPGCAISGSHRIKASLSKRRTSKRITSSNVVSIDAPTCDASNRSDAAEVTNLTGTGSVVAAGNTKKVRVYTPIGIFNSLHVAAQIQKEEGPGCPVVATTITQLPPSHPEAITVSASAIERTGTFVASECSPTTGIGAPCRVFILTAEQDKDDGGNVDKDFRVTGYWATNLGGGEFDSLIAISSSSPNAVGNFSVAKTFRTASLSVTANMVCVGLDCGISGPYTFRLGLEKGPNSTVQVTVVSQTAEVPPCRASSSFTEGKHRAFGGTGTAKGNGTTRALSIYSGIQGTSSFRVASTSQKVTQPIGGCPDPVVVQQPIELPQL